jgi:hypothetical protein
METLHKNRELMEDIVEEAMEDVALTHAIDEGLRSDPVPREDVFAICSFRNTVNEPAKQAEA